jgi:hypothetical protein
MVYTLIIILLGLSAAAGILRPQLGAVLIWTFAWLYPNSLLYDILPLNIRFDDLWVVYMFLVCLFLYRHGTGLGRLTWLAIAWWLSIFLGNMTGLLMTGGLAWQDIIKWISKSLYVPMTTYVLSCVLDSPRALEAHLKGLLISGVLAGALGIAMVYVPGTFSAFFISRSAHGLLPVEMVEAGEQITRRAQGSVGTNALAALSSSLALLALMMAVYQNRTRLRLFCGITCGALMVTLGYTVTRGVIGGVLAALLWAVLFTRRRWVLISLIVLGTIVLMWQGGLIERIMLRIVGQPGSPVAPFWEGLIGRFAILDMFARNFRIVYVFFGMGMPTVGKLMQATTHNTYLGSFVYSGVFGAIVLVLVITRGIRLGRGLLRAADDPFSQAIGSFMLMLVIALMTYGVVAENFQAFSAMQIYFAAMVFVEKRLLQVQAEQEAWLEAYAEQVGQLEPVA